MRILWYSLGGILVSATMTYGGEIVRSGAAAGDAVTTDAKVEALLRAMTLDEKIGQMTQVDFGALHDKADIQKYALGSVLSGGDTEPPENTPNGWAKAHDECQDWALRSRLKIPLIYGIDAVHGHNKVDGAVIFPHNVGLGATRDRGLVERVYRTTADEVAGTGIRWDFAPCVAVARDERWGRTYESFGEDTALVREMGAAAVHGLQGGRLSDPGSVLACAKHFLGDGGTRGGVDQGDTVGDEAELLKVHLPAYVDAIKAGVGSIMVSYSSFNGAKMHGHRRLVTDLLKGELGFRGVVVSDWAGIDQVATDYRQAVEVCVNAGLDMVMIPNGPGKKNNYVEFIGYLRDHVAASRVGPARIDDAVRRILRVKIEAGLFEHPFADRSLMREIGSGPHRRVARECVRKSLVLLKNEGHALPLSKTMKRLHVAGRGADDLGMQCGGWTITWQGKRGAVIRGGTTILAAVRQSVGPGTEVTYSADGSGADGADAVLVVVGEEPYAEMKGDRRDLALSPEGLDVVKKVKAAHRPVVTVLLSGRPLILGEALDASDGLVAAWLPGSEGQGVTDVLFGDFPPTGRLPHTWPRSMDQVPRNVGDNDRGQPLFPFGFGLGY
jgi:beta-glucosidase